MRVKRPMTQEEYLREIWYTNSRWGRRLRKRVAIFWTCIASGAIIGTLLGLFAR